MSKAYYQLASDLFDCWRDGVLAGSPPVLYPIGKGALQRIEVGPGLVTLIGGAPGSGKTAFAMQAVIDALRLTPALRVAVCNIEMPATVLMDRQLARLSGIDLTTIRYRKCDAAHSDRLNQALNTLEPLVDRLCFVRPPFDLENVAAVADEFHADLLVLDYIQRIPPPGRHGDRRTSVNATMNYLRQFADENVAVVVIAAVARAKDSQGRSSYHGDGLNLASFRESSELEFGADDAFILVPDPKIAERAVLRHLKARHTEPMDIQLRFDKARQHFTPVNANQSPTVKQVSLPSEISALWTSTKAADDDGEENTSDVDAETDS